MTLRNVTVKRIKKSVKPVLQITGSIYHAADVFHHFILHYFKALNVQISHAAQKSCLSAIVIST